MKVLCTAIVGMVMFHSANKLAGQELELSAKITTENRQITIHLELVNRTNEEIWVPVTPRGEFGPSATVSGRNKEGHAVTLFTPMWTGPSPDRNRSVVLKPGLALQDRMDVSLSSRFWDDPGIMPSEIKLALELDGANLETAWNAVGDHGWPSVQWGERNGSLQGRARTNRSSYSAGDEIEIYAQLINLGDRPLAAPKSIEVYFGETVVHEKWNPFADRKLIRPNDRSWQFTTTVNPTKHGLTPGNHELKVVFFDSENPDLTVEAKSVSILLGSDHKSSDK